MEDLEALLETSAGVPFWTVSAWAHCLLRVTWCRWL